jgi:predicted transcriptional regulator
LEEGEATEELLFALSSGDRMKLMSEIASQDLRLTDLAVKLNASVQETSKHLARLSEGKLIEKTVGGTYRLTPYGKVAFGILPSLKFISERRKYFLNHDVSFLPSDLLLRMGQLSENRFYDHITNVLVECQHLLGMAEKYFWWSIDEPLPWFISKKFEPELKVRVLLPTSTSKDSLERAHQVVGNYADYRFTEKVLAGVALNEKLAGIVFPDAEGKIDYSSGFVGYSSTFQKWCKDLFEWMWESASPQWPLQLESQLAESRHA